MAPIPVADLAFPALWLFVLGLLLSLGVWRMRRARLDARDDWARLVRFHDVLTSVEASRGRNEPARTELIALARALDEHVEKPEGRPGLAAQAVRFDPGAADGVDPREAEALASAIRRDILGADRAIQERMKESARRSGRFVPVFFAGIGGVLVVPLVAARHLGLVRRLTARRIEQGLWFHAALGVVTFILLAGTLVAAIRVIEVVRRVLRS